MDIPVSKRRRKFYSKFIAAAGLITLCIVMFKQSHDSSSLNKFSYHEAGITHVLVTGGAGYIGSHAALRLLKDSYRVTIVPMTELRVSSHDNGNLDRDLMRDKGMHMGLHGEIAQHAIVSEEDMCLGFGENIRDEFRDDLGSRV
ncbi:UDP-arabinose 4-epimerase 1-like [Pyrus ussuriensis x Pyrus communis]|uniref:UDP-arabinose 4-epimerase 1-like n=1 Tax=Pyrus ussuriensis x Pyrus communis TaxID=2448454 RepID=A0A5N5G6J4_9ROSA|nr:UDP-arabinose 4-epimerase 1-like [Pyrus ussuriensis x Pyrus communis]